MMTIDGISVSNVIKIRICRDRPYSEPFSFEVISVNAGDSAAYPTDAAKSKLIPEARLKTSFEHDFNLKTSLTGMKEYLGQMLFSVSKQIRGQFINSINSKSYND